MRTFRNESRKVIVVARSLDWNSLHSVPFLCEAVRSKRRIFLGFSVDINTKSQVSYFQLLYFVCL